MPFYNAFVIIYKVKEFIQILGVCVCVFSASFLFSVGFCFSLSLSLYLVQCFLFGSENPKVTLTLRITAGKVHSQQTKKHIKQIVYTELNERTKRSEAKRAWTIICFEVRLM